MHLSSHGLSITRLLATVSFKAFGIMMAATGQASIPRYFEDIAGLLGSFAVGATLVHSAACVLSDICDRDFDAQVGMLATHRCKL